MNASERGRRELSLTLMLAVAVALLALAIYVPDQAATTVGKTICTTPPSRVGQFPHPVLIVLFCLASFWLGRMAGHLREGGRIGPAHRRPAGGAAPHPERRFGLTREQLAAIVQGLLTLFLVTVVVLLAFETYALATSIWPITFYVRCANDIAGFQTIGGACIVCFLIGHWLWYPARGEI